MYTFRYRNDVNKVNFLYQYILILFYSVYLERAWPIWFLIFLSICVPLTKLWLIVRGYCIYIYIYIYSVVYVKQRTKPTFEKRTYLMRVFGVLVGTCARIDVVNVEQRCR